MELKSKIKIVAIKLFDRVFILFVCSYLGKTLVIGYRKSY